MQRPIISFLMAPLLIGMMTVSIVNAESFSGKLNGHGCAHGGHTCPADKLDPHLRFEPDFVLQEADGDYYFLTNVPRDTKVRHVLEEVRVTGTLKDKYNSILVDELMVKKGDEFKTVWSQELQDAAAEYIYGGGTWFQFSGEVN